MLTIIISRTKEKIETADGRSWTVNKMLLKDGDSLCSFQERKTFTNVTAVRFALKKGTYRIESLRVNEKIRIAVSKFLNEYHGKQDLNFDCYAFVNLICDVEPHKVKDMDAYWVTRPSAVRPKDGEIIFLVTPDGPKEKGSSFHHAAIHIGKGLYLSVLGAGGDLEVAGLEDMKREFGSSEVLSATPRHP